MSLRLCSVGLVVIGLTLLAAPAVAAPAPATCIGTDLVAKAKAEQPERFAAFEADAAKVPNAEGLLWRIEGKDAPASYLFGTMHSTEPDLVALSEPVLAALRGSKTVAVEIADGDGAKAQAELMAFVTKNGIDFEGKGLEGLSAEQAAEVTRRLEQSGMPPSIAPMLKPWFLGITLQVSACELKRMGEGKPAVDAVVEATGRKFGAKVVGLETIPEQLTAVSGISEETARRMIRDSVADRNSSDDLQATTLALYRGRRVGWYFAMKKQTFGDALDVSAYADFLEALVDRRNRLMNERSKALVETGGAFIAVGALHLPGANGLVELMRKDGYAVSKVW